MAGWVRLTQDINEEPAPRMFWPKEVWGEYATTLEDFKDPENAEQAVACLNHLVTDALRHLPECFEYMTKLTSPSVLSFCAIPQVRVLHSLWTSPALCWWGYHL
jgi:farnesyl-diphosphate farnesyltransferase